MTHTRTEPAASHTVAKVTTAVLLGAVMLQTALLLRWVVGPSLVDGRELIGLSAQERSARLAFGGGFADYVAFLRAHVPEAATVIIPSEVDDYALGHVGIMQYFLFPRTVADCPSQQLPAECVAGLGGMETYIMGVGAFPPAATALARRDFIAFDSRLGLYVPRLGAPVQP